ncbi:MAG TPA: metal ABC transporter permease [Acidimicrobiales bacterium]|nr:metal ABC transporter permease [Acidimicrobiales bacterium]
MPDLLRYPFMQHAYAAGTVVAVVAGVVGYFVVLRRLSFAAHGLSHVGFTGAAGAVALGISPVAGLFVFTCAGASVMGALGKRAAERDVVIGTVLAWMLGLGVLFLSLYHGSATSAYALLFGQVFGISGREVLVTLAAGLVTLSAVVVMWRPLLFSSVDEDVAEAAGVPVRGLSVAFLIVLALGVTVAVQVTGVLLIFALLVTPAAAAHRITDRPARTLAASIGIALLVTWAGLAIAYYTPYPVGFWITTLAFAAYLAARLVDWRRSR